MFPGMTRRLHIGGDTEEDLNVSLFISVAFRWKGTFIVIKIQQYHPHTGKCQSMLSKGSRPTSLRRTTICIHLYFRGYRRVPALSTCIANLNYMLPTATDLSLKKAAETPQVPMAPHPPNE